MGENEFWRKKGKCGRKGRLFEAVLFLLCSYPVIRAKIHSFSLPEP